MIFATYLIGNTATRARTTSFRIQNKGLKRNTQWILLIPNKITQILRNEIFSTKPFPDKGIDSGWPEKLVSFNPLYCELGNGRWPVGLASLGEAMKCRRLRLGEQQGGPVKTNV